MARAKTAPCKLCGCDKARVVEIETTWNDKVHYVAVCDNEKCRLSVVPGLSMCSESDEDAIAEWNEMFGQPL